MLSRQTRIWLMLGINGGFFLAEIVVGYYAGSLALVADSFHMLNDMLSLGVALWAIKVAGKDNYDPKYSYGWQRAEILGALVNAVFLLALCFMIVIEAIQRFVTPQEITDPLLVLIVGGAGLVGNLVGLVLFHEHGHGHGHGGHSHGHGHEHSSDIENVNGHHHHHGGGHLNMKGIFLHVLGDALGNIGVIASALFIWLTPFPNRYYFDPAISILISAIIFASALPLVKTTSVILLQAVPSRVSLNDMTNDLLQLDDVLSVHEVHVWQLSDTKLIASLHMRLRTYANYMEVATNVRRLLHRYGIHSATIQPEFSSSSLHDSKQQLTHESEKKGNIEFSSSSAGAFNAPSIASNSLTEDNNECTSDNESNCLLRCMEDSCAQNSCCPQQQSPKT